jgi:hypothetical protein
VTIVACEEKMLPHKRSLKGSARGEGIEAERRLAYVALTRAQQRLEIHYDTEHPSVFLYEAGILEPPVGHSRPPRHPPPAPGRSARKKQKRKGISLRAMLKELIGTDRPTHS